MTADADIASRPSRPRSGKITDLHPAWGIGIVFFSNNCPTDRRRRPEGGPSPSTISAF